MIKNNALAIGLAVALSLSAAAQDELPKQDRPDNAGGTKVVLLGTGTPNARPDRMGPSVAIIVGDQAYIVDAGTGIVRRAAALQDRFPALEASKLNIAFLTHLHTDHTLGLADLNFTPWSLGRAEPLRLYGPPGTKDMARHIVAAYMIDVGIRIDGAQPQAETGWRINAKEMGEGLVYSDAQVSVTATRACHGDFTDSFAYKFVTADRTILISGDTMYCPAVEAAAQGVDILVHEVISDEGIDAHPSPEWIAYHTTHHTRARDLAKLVNNARPGLLVLYHQLSWAGVPHIKILDEVKALTDVPVAYGRDLDVY